MNMLIVDDNPAYIKMMKSLFAHEKTQGLIHTASTYAQALSCLGKHSYDVALVDVELRCSRSGLDLCKVLASESDAIVLLLTGFDSRTTMQQAYEAGCHDYLRKPIDRNEPKFKVQCWYRTLRQSLPTPQKLLHRGLLYEESTGVLMFDGQVLKLSRSCKRLLLLLLENAATTVPHRLIERHLWGDHFSSVKPRNIAERVFALKKQLPMALAKYVQCDRSFGYILQ